MIFICFLLISPICLSTQDGNIRESGKCGPQTLTLETSKQVLQLTWEVDCSCQTQRDRLPYKQQVQRAGELLENATLTVTPEQLWAAHSWNPESLLALDCVSHSVRLRSRYNSQWKENNTPGVPQIHPRDGKFEVGSNVTFFCVVPKAQHFSRMSLKNFNVTNNKTSQVSSQIYAFTFQPNQATANSCTHINCSTKEAYHVDCAYFGYSPDDRDLRCETRDLMSVECTWTVGKAHRNVFKIETRYHLHEVSSKDNFSCSESRCTKKEKIDSAERTWILTSTNDLGGVALIDKADLTKRVHMFAPGKLSFSENHSETVFLRWSWEQPQYKNLNITCEVNISHGESNTLIESSGVGLNHTALSGVMPNVRHNVTVRCRTTDHFWKWGDPSAPFILEDVPDAPDIWMQTKDDQIHIVCKTPPTNPDRAQIVDYEVTWNAAGDEQGGKITRNTCKPALILNHTGEYTVELRARNRQRSSTASVITVPTTRPDKSATYWVIGSNGTFNLAWQSSRDAICGYILDWCSTQGQYEEEWLKVPPNQTNATVYLEKEANYSLSVYACTKGAPVLLEKRELLDCSMSLFKLKLKQQGSNVEISWDHLNVQEQATFIKSYTVYYYTNSQKQLNHIEVDRMTTIVTVENLEISTYSFTVVAETPLGACGSSSGFITLTGDDTPIRIWQFFIPVMFCAVIAILCCTYWTCIKEKMWPPIPTPVLTDKWPRPADCIAQQPKDEDAADISVLPRQQNMFPPYAKKPTDHNLWPLFTLCPTRAPFQAVLPVRGLLHNPTYDLSINLSLGDQSFSLPGLQGGTPLERCSEGYQPQGEQQMSQEPDQSCSAYILLPKSDPK